MTSRSYFGKMNSTLGSVVPLAMFVLKMDRIGLKIYQKGLNIVLLYQKYIFCGSFVCGTYAFRGNNSE